MIQRLVLLLLVVSCLHTVVLAEEVPLFDGKTLEGWSGNEGYWTVKDGAIVGSSPDKIAKNEFLWHEREVSDFHFSLEVKLDPPNRNAGIQFRSKKSNDYGQAHGYQADVGAGVWGKIYHEHGRGMLDWRSDEKSVKAGEWNKYEILAVGDRIWVAINGVITASLRDPKGEKKGYIALQIHSGPPQTVQYRKLKVTENPKVEFVGKDEKELNAMLIDPGAKTPAPGTPTKKEPAFRILPRSGFASAASAASGEPPAADWPSRIGRIDPGSQDLIWARAALGTKTWKTMKLPAHWEGSGLPGYDGVVWFRKRIVLPASADGKEGLLSLGPIDDMDVTWINGQRVGGYEKAGDHFTNRRYEIPRGVLKEGPNSIAIRVMDHGYGGGICGQRAQPELMFLTLKGSEPISLSGDWKYKEGASLAQLLETNAPQTTKSDSSSVGPWKNGFQLEGQVVVFTGGSEIVEMGRHGYLETLLTLAADPAATPPAFQNLAWQADTVYQRQRPRNFGTHADELKRVGATAIVASFGKMEAMDGVEKLPDFLNAYGALLDEYEKRTRQIVLTTPLPFERLTDSPLLPDLTSHNEAVAAYGAGIRKLAQERGYPVVDLGKTTDPSTRDGIHLNQAGHWQTARETVRHLLGEEVSVPGGIGESDGSFTDPKMEKLRQSVIHKNDLWHRHWRPTNWAFVYGNRQHVASSKDHRPGQPRWFPAEIDAILPMIDAEEQKIAQLRQEVVR